MKKYVGTALTVCIVLSFIVLSIVWHGNAFTNDQMSTFKMLLIVCGCSIAYCFIVGEITRNYSQMDKLWSLLPIAYSWIIAIQGGMSARLIVFALIVSAWGVRLTINFARKGAYRDYIKQVCKYVPLKRFDPGKRMFYSMSGETK